MTFNNVTNVQELCLAMGLSAVDGSYEKALALNLGASAPINNSWLQAAYPIMVSKRNQLIAQTYSTTTISGYVDNYLDLLNYPSPVDGHYYYVYNRYIGAYTNSSFFPIGLYQYNELIGYQWISTDVISYCDNNLMALFNINVVDDVQTNNITTAQSNISSLQSSVTTLQGQVIAPTYNNAPTVSLNTSNQLSTTNKTRVSYTVSITTALSLLNLNAAGQAFLEISPNGTTWTTINSAGISRTLGVAISVGLNETAYYNIQGEVPTGWYRRIRTTTSGGASVAFVSGQEVQY